MSNKSTYMYLTCILNTSCFCPYIEFFTCSYLSLLGFNTKFLLPTFFQTQKDLSFVFNTRFIVLKVPSRKLLKMTWRRPQWTRMVDSQSANNERARPVKQLLLFLQFEQIDYQSKPWLGLTAPHLLFSQTHGLPLRVCLDTAMGCR